MNVAMKKSFWLLAITAILMVFSACKETEIPENRVFSINDLGHKRVGVQIGNTAEIYASDYGGDSAKIQVERFATLAEAVQALRQGEIDAVLCDDAPATVFVSRSPSLRILDEVFMEEDYAGIVGNQDIGPAEHIKVIIIPVPFQLIGRRIFQHQSLHQFLLGRKGLRMRPDDDSVTGF